MVFFSIGFNLKIVEILDKENDAKIFNEPFFVSLKLD